MQDLLDKQEVQITMAAKKHKVSCPSGSMTQILDELEETASSPCQTSLAPQHDG